MGRSSRCTDQSASYKSRHSTCEMGPLGECYAASAVEEGCNSPTHQSSDGSTVKPRFRGRESFCRRGDVRLHSRGHDLGNFYSYPIRVAGPKAVVIPWKKCI
ncbi:hypothetical protein SK128_018362 [Halocaridina rubra]|uniref:Uncharacterized protein n=1 Tax=Halocaridina rubra TaxID=373956 RepID=A0AAN9A6L5_HALRR